MSELKDNASESVVDEHGDGGSASTEMTYVEAVRELESILLKIEQPEVDIDVLSSAVERAATLLKFCRSRINRAETKIVRALGDMEQEVSWQEDRSDDSETD